MIRLRTVYRIFNKVILCNWNCRQLGKGPECSTRAPETKIALEDVPIQGQRIIVDVFWKDEFTKTDQILLLNTEFIAAAILNVRHQPNWIQISQPPNTKKKANFSRSHPYPKSWAVPSWCVMSKKFLEPTSTNSRRCASSWIFKDGIWRKYCWVYDNFLHCPKRD